MPILLKEELVLCCEGKADQQFFRKLIEKRDGIPAFDMPFPTEKLYGNSNFGGMLEAIRGDRVNFPRIKGVLIVADSADKPDEIFKSIASQIKSVGGYAVPSKLSEVASVVGHPALAVMTLPDNQTPGGLETLLVAELAAKHSWITSCVDDYLKCKQITAHTWPAEKLDKARFHCMVAAINKDDPSKSASTAFKDPTPLIAVGARCFDNIARRVMDFCEAVGALHRRT